MRSPARSIKAVTKQLEMSRTKAEAAELTFCQLKKETTNSLRLRVGNCMLGSSNVEMAKIGFAGAAIDGTQDQRNCQTFAVSKISQFFLFSIGRSARELRDRDLMRVA